MTQLKWKKYREALSIIWDKSRSGLSLKEAIELILKTSKTTFDSTVEIHVNLNIDVKHADQMVRWTTSLPHWTWKVIRVAAFVPDENKKKAIAAWADIAWIDELIEDITKWKLEFDVAIATPDCMKDLWKVAKILWPKWLMPSPKSWTVVQDFEWAIKAIKKWKVEFKADKTWIVHNWIWKVSFWKDKIYDNLKSFLSAVIEAKPTWCKWSYLNSVALTTTMWPSVFLDNAKLLEECR